jgi:hypothetical protein
VKIKNEEENGDFWKAKLTCVLNIDASLIWGAGGVHKLLIILGASVAQRKSDGKCVHK